MYKEALIQLEAPQHLYIEPLETGGAYVNGRFFQTVTFDIGGATMLGALQNQDPRNAYIIVDPFLDFGLRALEQVKYGDFYDFRTSFNQNNTYDNFPVSVIEQLWHRMYYFMNNNPVGVTNCIGINCSIESLLPFLPRSPLDKLVSHYPHSKSLPANKLYHLCSLLRQGGTMEILTESPEYARQLENCIYSFGQMRLSEEIRHHQGDGVFLSAYDALVQNYTFQGQMELTNGNLIGRYFVRAHRVY